MENPMKRLKTGPPLSQKALTGGKSRGSIKSTEKTETEILIDKRLLSGTNEEKKDLQIRSTVVNAIKNSSADKGMEGT